eukprot:SAG11_NODE_2265_length_3604_cov_1.956646_4_plen_69_part_00
MSDDDSSGSDYLPCLAPGELYMAQNWFDILSEECQTHIFNECSDTKKNTNCLCHNQVIDGHHMFLYNV